MPTHFERKLVARDKGLCPDCGATLEKCEPGEVHRNYLEVPKGWAWARRCPVEGCGFRLVSMGPDFRMTNPPAGEAGKSHDE